MDKNDKKLKYDKNAAEEYDHPNVLSEDDKQDDHISGGYLDDNRPIDLIVKCRICDSILTTPEQKDKRCYICGTVYTEPAVVKNVEGVSLPSGTRVFVTSGMYIAGTVGNLTTSDDMGDLFVTETLLNFLDVKAPGSFINSFIEMYILADGHHQKLLKPVAISLIKEFHMGC